MVRLLLLAAIAAMSVSAPALAHHPMGGTTPATLAEGLLSGLGHPLLGLDHFAFIIAAGLLAAPRRRALLLPAAFVAGSFAGALLHLGAVVLPGGEYLIAGSVILMGLLLASGGRIDDPGFAACLGLAGLLHGHALAESIFGAEATPLVAYLGGLAVAEYAIAAAVIGVWRLAAAAWPGTLPRVSRFAGAGVAAIGAAFLVLHAAG